MQYTCREFFFRTDFMNGDQLLVQHIAPIGSINVRVPHEDWSGSVDFERFWLRYNSCFCGGYGDFLMRRTFHGLSSTILQCVFHDDKHRPSEINTISDSGLGFGGWTKRRPRWRGRVWRENQTPSPMAGSGLAGEPNSVPDGGVGFGGWTKLRPRWRGRVWRVNQTTSPMVWVGFGGSANVICGALESSYTGYVVQQFVHPIYPPPGNCGLVIG